VSSCAIVLTVCLALHFRYNLSFGLVLLRDAVWLWRVIMFCDA
jgi:hypothetical protein